MEDDFLNTLTVGKLSAARTMFIADARVSVRMIKTMAAILNPDRSGFTPLSTGWPEL